MTCSLRHLLLPNTTFSFRGHRLPLCVSSSTVCGQVVPRGRISGKDSETYACRPTDKTNTHTHTYTHTLSVSSKFSFCLLSRLRTITCSFWGVVCQERTQASTCIFGFTTMLITPCHLQLPPTIPNNCTVFPPISFQDLGDSEGSHLTRTFNPSFVKTQAYVVNIVTNIVKRERARCVNHLRGYLRVDGVLTAT